MNKENKTPSTEFSSFFQNSFQAYLYNFIQKIEFI